MRFPGWIPHRPGRRNLASRGRPATIDPPHARTNVIHRPVGYTTSGVMASYGDAEPAGPERGPALSTGGVPPSKPMSAAPKDGPEVRGREAEPRGTRLGNAARSGRPRPVAHPGRPSRDSHPGERRLDARLAQRRLDARARRYARPDGRVAALRPLHRPHRPARPRRPRS